VFLGEKRSGRPKVADLPDSTVTLKLKTADFQVANAGPRTLETDPTRGQDFSGWMRALDSAAEATEFRLLDIAV
jgi:hypothetical protein